MRRIWIPRIGGPEVLQVREESDPDPGPGEVRIRAQASGINFADIMARMGLYPDAPPLPTVVGYELAGTVDAVGEGVTDLAVGARVLAMTRFGGYSDVICAPRLQVLPIPDELSFERAAAVPVNYLTAWIMLVRFGNLQRGERVLVHAAAGGVGQAAVQIARWRDAEIFGTASGGKHDRLRESGVAHCIDYTRVDFEQEVRKITGGEGVHLIIDAVGGKSFSKSYRLLAPMGRLCMFGVSSFAPGKRRSVLAAASGLLSMPKFKPVALMNENRGVFGVNMGHLWDQADQLVGMLEQVMELIGEGILDPVVDRTFPFDQAAEAHRYIQDRKNFGKVLLVP